MICLRNYSVGGAGGESNEFSTTVAMWLEYSHGVCSKHKSPRSRNILFIIAGAWLQDTWLGLIAQGTSRFPQSSNTVHILKQNLCGITQFLRNGHCTWLVWFMWRFLSWIIGSFSKMNNSRKTTGKGWEQVLPCLLGHVYNLTPICGNNYNCKWTDGPVPG